MSWAKLDDRFHGNPKVMAAWTQSPAAIGLYVMGITYCAQHETDGHIDVGFVRLLLPKPRDFKVLPKVLTDVGLWTEEDGGWHVKAFLEFNPSREENATRRDWDRKRKTLYRDQELIDAIRKRDRDRCRYCSVKVNWKDRRGATGGTYDHVQPRGENTYDNVVVACKACNSAKGARTPDEARMPLLPPGATAVSSSGTKSVTSSDLPTDLHTRPDPTRPQVLPTPIKGSPLGGAGMSNAARGQHKRHLGEVASELP